MPNVTPQWVSVEDTSQAECGRCQASFEARRGFTLAGTHICRQCLSQPEIRAISAAIQLETLRLVLAAGGERADRREIRQKIGRLALELGG